MGIESAASLVWEVLHLSKSGFRNINLLGSWGHRVLRRVAVKTSHDGEWFRLCFVPVQLKLITNHTVPVGVASRTVLENPRHLLVVIGSVPVREATLSRMFVYFASRYRLRAASRCSYNFFNYEPCVATRFMDSVAHGYPTVELRRNSFLGASLQCEKGTWGDNVVTIL